MTRNRGFMNGGMYKNLWELDKAIMPEVMHGALVASKNKGLSVSFIIIGRTCSEKLVYSRRNND